MPTPGFIDVFVRVCACVRWFMARLQVLWVISECMWWMGRVFYEELCGAVKSIRSLHHWERRGERVIRISLHKQFDQKTCRGIPQRPFLPYCFGLVTPTTPPVSHTRILYKRTTGFSSNSSQQGQDGSQRVKKKMLPLKFYTFLIPYPTCGGR